MSERLRKKRGVMERRYTQHPSPAPRDDNPSEYTLAALADDEAVKLAERIKAYWSKRGRKVDVRLVKENGYLQVRSNLVNGVPPR